MATIKSKADLYADSALLPTPITRAALIAHMDNMVASYENLIQEYTTVQRDALTPFEGQKIYNTTSNRLEYYSASQWTPMSQKETVAIDCSANPNYPEALIGDQYIVSVAGLIGGASGLSVYVGDIIYAINDNAGGTQAGVGASWAICHSQSASDSPTYYAEISLSSAQILALNSSPQTLVAAPGAGKIIIPLSFITNYTHVTTAYNNATPGLKYEAGATILSGVTPALNTVTASQIFTSAIVNVNNDRWYANSLLQVFVASADPTTGDGTMTVGVYYKIHTL